MTNLTQSPPTNPSLSFGSQVSGQIQPDGSWYRPFSPAGVNSQGRIANGILATPSVAGAGNVYSYSDFSFGGQGGSGLFPQNGAPSAALLSTSDLSQPVNLQDAAPPDTARFVVKGVRPNYNISLDTALPDGSTVGDRVNALSQDINNRTAQVIATPYGPVLQYGDRSDPVSIVTDVYNEPISKRCSRD